MSPTLYISCCQWLLVAALTALGWSFPAQSEDTLSPLELQGRQIYQQGQDGSKEAINVTLGLTNTTLSAQTFPCINCHSADGEGKIEGSLTIPAITANQLYSPATGEGHSRIAYTDDSLAQAINNGQKPNGQALDTAMPRYGLTKPQMAALLAYLKRLGSIADLDPGLSDNHVQVASILPLTGRLQATGHLLKATLEACIAEANTHGLIYGRSLSVSIADSGSTPEGELSATRHLQASPNTFALLARYSVNDQSLPITRIPDIAPITFTPSTQATTDTGRFYILPSFADQARALVDYALTLPELTRLNRKPRVAIIYGQQAINQQIAGTVRQQAKLQNVTVSHTFSWQTDKHNKAINMPKNQKPEAIFFLGNALELKAFNDTLTKSAPPPILFGLLGMLGSAVLQNPPSAFAKIYLATPFAYSTGQLQHLSARIQPYNVPLKNPSLQSIACAAVDMLVEGLKQGGRHVSRLKLNMALANLHNFTIDFLPPLTYASNAAFSGTYVISLDQKGILQQSNWITPTYKR